MSQSPDNTVLNFPGRVNGSVFRCGLCAMWLKVDQGPSTDLRAPAIGFCRRFPPTLHAMGPIVDDKNRPIPGPHGGPMPNYQPARPVVQENDYCGEYQPLPKPAAPRG